MVFLKPDELMEISFQLKTKDFLFTKNIFLPETLNLTGVSGSFRLFHKSFIKNKFGSIEKLISHLHQQKNKKVLRNLQHIETAKWFSPCVGYTMSGVQSTIVLST